MCVGVLFLNNALKERIALMEAAETTNVSTAKIAQDVEHSVPDSENAFSVEDLNKDLQIAGRYMEPLQESY